MTAAQTDVIVLLEHATEIADKMQLKTSINIIEIAKLLHQTNVAQMLHEDLEEINQSLKYLDKE